MLCPYRSSILCTQVRLINSIKNPFEGLSILKSAIDLLSCALVLKSGDSKWFHVPIFNYAYDHLASVQVRLGNNILSRFINHCSLLQCK